MDLEDVDRIEVIRGPGATVWGANAVNGVINIVSKSARDTQGGYLYTSGGTVGLTADGVRYGGKLADNTYYRFDLGYQLTDDYPLANGQSAGDGWQSEQYGYRLDNYSGANTHLTWQGRGGGESTGRPHLGRLQRQHAGPMDAGVVGPLQCRGSDLFRPHLPR